MRDPYVRTRVRSVCARTTVALKGNEVSFLSCASISNWWASSSIPCASSRIQWVSSSISCASRQIQCASCSASSAMLRVPFHALRVRSTSISCGSRQIQCASCSASSSIAFRVFQVRFNAWFHAHMRALLSLAARPARPAWGRTGRGLSGKPRPHQWYTTRGHG